jgi:molybdate-binding protein
VVKSQGRGTQLTDLGKKLLWAEQRSDAGLFPQLENIASELNLEIAKSLKTSTPVIRIHASHGFAVARIPELMHHYGHATIDLQYMASNEALNSLSKGNCDCAGFHIPEGKLGYDIGMHYLKKLNANKHKIIRLVTRTQGLMIAAGNPHDIHTLQDLLRPTIRFVNRQLGSGTRLLLETLLHNDNIDSAHIHGYNSGEFTHAAIAAFVASGMADVGFGVEAAARQFKLDFIPFIREHYMLACQQSALQRADIQDMISHLKETLFLNMIDQLPGYAPDQPGEIVSLKDFLTQTTNQPY